LRYYLSANAPENKDADFTWKDFQARYNGDLADVLGNLINRCLSFVEKNFENRVPPAGALTDADREALGAIEKASDAIGGAISEFQVRRAVGELMDLARAGNKYFNDAAPWTAMKTDRARAATILNTTIQLEAALSLLMEPFLPHSAEKLRKMLNFSFARHPKLNMPEEHLAAIEKHLRKRSSQLIGLSRSKEKTAGAAKKRTLQGKLEDAKRKAAEERSGKPAGGKKSHETE
jgi:methionyl-tRNA synthetase